MLMRLGDEESNRQVIPEVVGDVIAIHRAMG